MSEFEELLAKTAAVQYNAMQHDNAMQHAEISKLL